MFNVGNEYSRKDIYKILSVPEHRQKGNWNTGYVNYEGKCYVFVNLGTPGRTGHDHANYWNENILYWKAKKNSHLQQKSIKDLLDPNIEVNIFTRTDSKNVNFIYQGLGKVEKYENTSPVTVYWRFEDEVPDEIGDEIDDESTYIEGAVKKIKVNAYERNKEARKKCINHYGCVCSVCNINLNEVYGDIAKDFIHVHHLKMISELKNEYVIDPINDLRPVCPNCHSIIHKKKPPFTIDEMKNILLRNR